MIVIPKHKADPLLRLLVFVRPLLPWLAVFVALCGVTNINSGRQTDGMVHLGAAVVAVLCYLATQKGKDNL